MPRLTASAHSSAHSGGCRRIAFRFPARAPQPRDSLRPALASHSGSRSRSVSIFHRSQIVILALARGPVARDGRRSWPQRAARSQRARH
jgi:hypothetical protein